MSEGELKNFVIIFQDWEGINAHSKEESVEIFKRTCGHPDAEIVRVE